MPEHIKNAIARVLRQPRYAALSCAVGLGLYLFVNLLPNYSLILTTITSDASLGYKASLIASLVQSSFAIPLSSLLMQGVLMLLVGVSSSLIVYKALLDQGLVGFHGVFSTLFAIGSSGCATCGMGILPLLGLSGVVAILPFKGLEFWFIGMGLVLFTIHKTSKTITRCELKHSAC